jgi:hypothetical protein
MVRQTVRRELAVFWSKREFVVGRKTRERKFELPIRLEGIGRGAVEIARGAVEIESDGLAIRRPEFLGWGVEGFDDGESLLRGPVFRDPHRDHGYASR